MLSFAIRFLNITIKCSADCQVCCYNSTRYNALYGLLLSLPDFVVTIICPKLCFFTSVMFIIVAIYFPEDHFHATAIDPLIHHSLNHYVRRLIKSDQYYRLQNVLALDTIIAIFVHCIGYDDRCM